MSIRVHTLTLARSRYVDCEKWRKEFGVDYLVRNFSYEEKPLVSHYYPQYYHKTDKVSCLCGCQARKAED